MIATPRERLSLHVRAFPGWERLRGALGAVLGLPVDQVRALADDADPAVRLDARARVLGFRLEVDLFVDARRVRLPALDVLAARLAGELELDVAYHDGSRNPYSYVLQRPTGERFVAFEVAGGDADGLLLAEAPGELRALP